jgi:ubiquinone/menaquinone biosynthesis C-methylase UbiE
MNKTLWERLSLLPRELIARTHPEIVLDLGGGTGDFASPLKTENATVITLDTNPDALKSRIDGIQAVLGDATRLPFKDSSIDAVTARAILHHFPESLDGCLGEVDRVLKSGGLFLAQEPLANNILANLARRYISTERHEAGERPLDPDFLEKSVGERFDIQWKEHHFLLSYLYPHVVFRLPETLKSLGRLEGRLVHKLDEASLRTMPKLRKYAAYMSILGSKQKV